MKLSCPQCSQHIEIDDASLKELQGMTSIECPTCSGAVPVGEFARVRGSEKRALANTPARIAAALARTHRNVRILGILALLVLGGLAIYLATRPAGNDYNTRRLIRDQIIQNEFFTRLIASGATTKKELEAVEEIVPYGAGFIGLSGEKYSLNQAHDMAARTSSDVLDVSLTAKDSRKEFGGWLAENFPSSLGRTSWVRADGRERVIDSPDILPTQALDIPRRVFLSWPKADGWKNLGWSWTIPAQFDEVKPFSQWGLAAARVGKQWGILDESGKWLQQPQFDFLEKVSEHGCVRVQVGEKWGLINRQGALAAKPEWEDVQDQINGFTPVKKDGKWGYLDASEALIIPTEWADAWRFSPEGYAVVTRDFKRGIIDRSGKIIVKPEWDGAINFSQEGLGMLRRGDGWALIDTTGKQLTEPVLDTVWRYRRWDLGVLPVTNGTAAVGLDGKAVTGAAQEDLQRTLLKVSPKDYSEGLAVVKGSRNEHGIIDMNGQWVVPLRMGGLRRFAGGFAASEAVGKWGFIDRAGKVVVKQEWKAVKDFHGGLAAVQNENGWGFIDRTGKIVVKPEWAEVRPFIGSRAAVRRAALWGFVNASGDIIAAPAWKAVGDFSEGFASVKVEPTVEQSSRLRSRYELWSFIDSTGKLAFEGRSWMAWKSSGSKPPQFENGKASSIQNSRHEWIQLDTLGRENPNNWWQKPLTPGLAFQEQNRPGNYLNRHGEAGLSNVLIASDGSVVMADVNSRADLLSDFIPHAAPPKYGLIDMTGKVLVPPTWDEARILSPDWVWFRLGGKRGLADKTGRIVIPPEWDELDILHVRSGSLAEDGKTALVGSSGTTILSPWVMVKRDGKSSILRTDGTPAVPETMTGVEYVDFYGPDHVVLREVDAQGGVMLMIHEPATRRTRRFPAAAKLLWNWNSALHGFIWLQTKDTLVWALKGKDGKDYAHTQPEIEIPTGWGFVEGRARLHKPDGWIHIEADGKPISAQKWEQIRDFREGRAAVSRAGKWGFIDLKGTVVGELVYDEVRDFNEGLAAVRQAASWGFLALNGVLASEMKYEYVRDLERGLAAVKVGGRWGYVDGQGLQVIEPVWDEAENFFAWEGEPDAGVTPSLDVAEVKIKGAAALIGRDGALIVDPRTPSLTRDDAAYINDKEQLIVMQKGGLAAVTKRSFPPTPKGHPRLYYKVAVDVSPALQWQWSDAALKSAVDALANNDWRSMQSLQATTWRLVNETGETIAEGDWGQPWYDQEIDPFAGELISARSLEQKYGLIRKDGSVVIAPRFDRIAWVAPGIAAVWSLEVGGLMKADGQWIFKDSDTVRLARFGLKRSRKTENQHRHGLALIEDVPKWGYARLNRLNTTPKAP